MNDLDASSPRSRDRGEDGFAAVFTVIILFVLLAIAALALDLGGLRAQREADRGATDLAAAAGALSLSDSSSMVTGCLGAWNYAVTNIGNSSSAYGLDCAPFATTCDPTTARTATATVGSYTITITNPVPDTSPLMGSHTIGGATQPLNASVDGSPCQRVGVTIAFQRASVFAQILGTRSSTTTTSSVALASVGSSKGAPPALLILESSACNALVASGQGNIEAQGNGDTPGFIAVDSSGTGGSGSNSCSSGGRYALDASGTTNSSIIADTSPSGSTPGVIDIYALAQGQGTSSAYDPSDVPTRVSPTPVAEATRVTRAPVDWRYNCTAAGQDGVVGTADDCKAATATSDYITQLHRLYDTSNPYNAPTVPSGFTTYPRAGVAGDSCSPNGAAITLPAGNWYINCPSGFTVSNNFTIGGGNIVFAGGFNVQGSSLTINPTGSPTTIVYVRAGDISKSAQAALTMNHTTALLQNGVLNLGGGSGALNWTSPNDPLSPYDDLAVWSESANAHAMGGQTTLSLDGVFFMPNAPFIFSGQGAQYQTTAQFVSRTLLASGQGTLRIRPDPTRAIYVPNVGERLIR